MKHGAHGTRIAGNIELGRPGAGIPWHERIPVGLFLKLGARMRSPHAVTADFLIEGRRILDLVRAVLAAQARRPVLIRRVRDIEDASRYWSLYMVLDHLIQVDTAVWVLIRRLAAGHQAGLELSIAAVKPSPDAGPDRMEDFSSLIGRYAETLSRLGDIRRHTSITHAHPWFGQVNAAQWNLLAERHHRVHGRQVDRILAGLRRFG